MKSDFLVPSSGHSGIAEEFNFLDKTKFSMVFIYFQGIIFQAVRLSRLNKLMQCFHRKKIWASSCSLFCLFDVEKKFFFSW